MTPSPPENRPDPDRTTPPSPAPRGPRPSLPLGTATQMLRLGLAGPRRPVDDLIDRLSRPDGGEWLVRALEEGALRDVGSPAELLVEGRASIEQLVTMKERSHALIRSGSDGETRLAGIAGYFFALAAALRHHGRALSSRSRDELDPVLLDLAAVVPSPYTELMSDATLSPR